MHPLIPARHLQCRTFWPLSSLNNLQFKAPLEILMNFKSSAAFPIFYSISSVTNYLQPYNCFSFYLWIKLLWISVQLFIFFHLCISGTVLSKASVSHSKGFHLHLLARQECKWRAKKFNLWHVQWQHLLWDLGVWVFFFPFDLFTGFH